MAIRFAEKPEPVKIKRGRPKSGYAPKVVVSVRLDPDLVDAMRKTGEGWQVRMNNALRKHFLKTIGGD